MSIYRFAFIKDGEVVFHAERDFPEEAHALEAAGKLSADFEMEVWRGDQFVARFKKLSPQ